MAATRTGRGGYVRSSKGFWALIWLVLSIIVFIVAGVVALLEWTKPDGPKAVAALIAFGLALFAAAHV